MQRLTHQIKFLVLTFMLLLSSGHTVFADPDVKTRPDNWASAIPEKPGLPNFFQVSEILFRSAQPLQAGFAYLDTQPTLGNAAAPIRTIISLRAFHDDVTLVPNSSRLYLEQIRFKTWHPEDEDVVKFLRIATTPSMQPVLVHCLHGSDRTGTMVAIYRIVVQGWTKKQATDEMVNGGFGFHPMWQNLIKYINTLDVDAIKKQLATQGAWK